LQAVTASRGAAATSWSKQPRARRRPDLRRVNRAPPGLESLIPAPPSASELLRGRLRAPRADEAAGARICAVGDRPPLQAVAGEMATVASRHREQRSGRDLLEQATSSSTATGSASGGPVPPPLASRPQVLRAAGAKVVAEEAAAGLGPARSSSAVASRGPARRREWRRARSGARAGAGRRETGADRAVEMQTPRDARARGLAAFCSSICSCRWSHYSGSRARKT
jgi:hypothetical protein